MGKGLILTLFLAISPIAFARDYLIYAIDRDLPMGYKNEVIRKNFYLNIGSNQGVKKGTALDVVRTIAKQNPYDNRKMVNYTVKIGKIKVLHANDEAAIAVTDEFYKDDAPLFEVGDFMVGDKVTISVD